MKAQIIKDSINSETDDRLTTFVVEFPRFINAEVLRHRMLSFNSASSRAIPIKRIIESVQNNPAMPVFWGKNQSGMQAYEALEPNEQTIAQKVWIDSSTNMIEVVKSLELVGLHKQISNRLLEPWQNITLIISGTEWENFFKLRASTFAQPEFKELAYMMLELYNNNIPTIKTPADTKWFTEVLYSDAHVPYEENMPEGVTGLNAIKIAIARCARVSYLTQDGEIDPPRDYELYDRLLSGGHFSPCEHVAFPAKESKFYGNFKGWVQYRKTLFNENSVDSRVIKRKVIDGKVI